MLAPEDLARRVALFFEGLRRWISLGAIPMPDAWCLAHGTDHKDEGQKTDH